MIRRLLLLAVVAAAGAAGAYAYLEARAEVPELPPIRQDDPEPGSPPVVWVSGTLIEVTASSLTIREGGGPTVAIQRFAEGATRFFRPAVGEWRLLGEAQVARLGAGAPVCVEALLDGERLLGLRVFLQTRCAPVP